MTRLARYLSAALILVSGMIHLLLWKDEYAELPLIGILFLANAGAAVLIAAALLGRPPGAFALAGLSFAVLTLVAFVLSRTVGLFGVVESTIDAAAVAAGSAELVAVVLLTVWFRATRRKPDQPPVVGERMEPPGSPLST